MSIEWIRHGKVIGSIERKIEYSCIKKEKFKLRHKKI